MEWNKRKKSAAVIYGIAALSFVILVLVIPFSKPAASWVMFAFSIISFVIGLGISLYAFGKSKMLMSKFYGYPVFRIGFLYTATQVILSIIVFTIGAFVNISYWVGIVISVLLLGMASIGVIAVDNARDYMEEIDVKTVSSIKTITKFNNDIADVLDLCKSDAIKEPLLKLVTKFKYSDPVSSTATEEKERIIEIELEKLQGLISSNEESESIAQIERISNLLNSRNRICETRKQ